MEKKVKTDVKVLVIGAGLAGCEAAYFLAKSGIQVVLLEGKTLSPNPSQKLQTFAELVCTNSLKSNKPASGHGILKYEMRKLGSLILEVAELTSVPAGDALAVDREKFSERISQILKDHPRIEVVEKIAADPLSCLKEFSCQYAIVATGPLTASPLEAWMKEHLGDEDLYFYDAIAPVVDSEGLDFSKLYYKDRHKTVSEEEGEKADYLNAPMNKTQYEAFVTELVNAEKVPSKMFEKEQFFESCLPIDLMAERGVDTPRFSCMKPIGLEMESGELPYACVQLRRENLQGSAFNLVGFQTRLKYGEQKRIFSMIPGLEKAQFLHLGQVHRNTFLNAQKILNWDFSSQKFPHLYFAGQITGVEGYTESAAMGLYVASQVQRKIAAKENVRWPIDTATGALVHYVMTAKKPAPSNINFGLLPSVTLDKNERKNRKMRKVIKKEKAAERARESFDAFYGDLK